MDLNAFRDEVADFLRVVDPRGRESDARLLAMLEEKYADLKRSARKPGQLPHRIYDVLFMLFEMAAKHHCDLDAEWAAGRIRKRKYKRGRPVDGYAWRSAPKLRRAIPAGVPAVKMSIVYKNRKSLSPRSIQALLRSLEWSDWWTLKDIQWYLAQALFVVSAWHGRKLVGLGVLTGDGRINVNIDKLIVAAAYQRHGIGTAILERLVARVERLKPYSFQTDVCEECAERLYRRFGFEKNTGTWLLSHRPTWRRWGPRAIRERKERRKK